MNNEKHGQGTHCAKMGADSSDDKPQMPQNLFAQFVCPSPKVLDFNEKRLHWTFVVGGFKNVSKESEKIYWFILQKRV